MLYVPLYLIPTMQSFVYFSFSVIANNLTSKLVLSVPPPGKKRKFVNNTDF